MQTALTQREQILVFIIHNVVCSNLSLCLSCAGGGHRGETSFSADHLSCRLLPQAHGGAQRPQARKCTAGWQHECQDR